jgi:hypothetical protein
MIAPFERLPRVGRVWEGEEPINRQYPGSAGLDAQGVQVLDHQLSAALAPFREAEEGNYIPLRRHRLENLLRLCTAEGRGHGIALPGPSVFPPAPSS